MPRDGRRPGAGRKPGQLNRRTIEAVETMGPVAECAIGVLVSAMEDARVPWSCRIQAASLACTRFVLPKRYSLRTALERLFKRKFVAPFLFFVVINSSRTRTRSSGGGRASLAPAVRTRRADGVSDMLIRQQGRLARHRRGHVATPPRWRRCRRRASDSGGGCSSLAFGQETRHCLRSCQ
jgi:hypothetical protein